jgi:hypothetical protein
LEDEKKFVGEEFEEIDDQEENIDGLFDLILPPGVNHKIIMEAVQKFNLEITTREVSLKTIDIDKDNLLVLRGQFDDINEAQNYIYQKMSEKYKYKRP